MTATLSFTTSQDDSDLSFTTSQDDSTTFDRISTAVH